MTKENDHTNKSMHPTDKTFHCSDNAKILVDKTLQIVKELRSPPTRAIEARELEPLFENLNQVKTELQKANP